MSSFQDNQPAPPLAPERWSPGPLGVSDDVVEELNRVWTVARIFSSSAHDVNNALQVISGSAELLLEAKEGLDPVVLRRVQTIRAQTARATEAIARLLRYTRHASGGVEIVDLASLVDAAVTMRAATLKGAAVSIDVTRSDEEPYRVSVEPRAMLQVLLTLLLFFEKTLVPRAPGRIAIALSRSPGAVAVSLSSEAQKPPSEGELDPWNGDGLAARQLEAITCLVARQHGSIAIDALGLAIRSATLTLPKS